MAFNANLAKAANYANKGRTSQEEKGFLFV